MTGTPKLLDIQFTDEYDGEKMRRLMEELSRAVDEIASTDPFIAGGSAGDILVFDGADWTAQSHTVAQISDTVLTSPADGEILRFDGTNWINNTLAEAGISAPGHTHTEAEITDLGAYLLNIVEDTSPQLGARLEGNSFSISLDNTSAYMIKDFAGTSRAVAQVGAGDDLLLGNASLDDIELWTQSLGTVSIMQGSLFRVRSAIGGDYLQLDHDGTDVNMSGFQTTDLNLTGFTNIQALGINASFKDLNLTGNLDMDGGSDTAQLSGDVRMRSLSGTAYLQARDGVAATDIRLQLRTQQSGSIVTTMLFNADGSANMPHNITLDTASLIFDGGAQTFTMAHTDSATTWTGSGTHVNMVLGGGGDFRLRSGTGFSIWESANVDNIRMTVDGTDANVVGTTVRHFRIGSGFTGQFQLRDGMGLDIFASGNTPAMRLDHDGTDLNLVSLTGSTIDWNITGLTSIQAGTVNADFQAITAESYGGILEANLVSKISAETITGQWEFNLPVIIREASVTTGFELLQLDETADNNVSIRFGHIGAADKWLGMDSSLDLVWATGTNLDTTGDKIWHAGNDGPGSGLDADTIDTIAGSNLMTFAGAQIPDLTDINDTDISFPATGDLLSFNSGSDWQNKSLSVLGIPTITGTHTISGAWKHTAMTLDGILRVFDDYAAFHVDDTRALNPSPATLRANMAVGGTRWDFKTLSSIDAPPLSSSTFGGVQTMVPWTDDSGGMVYQTAWYADSAGGTEPRVSVRAGKTTGGWGTWRAIPFVNRTETITAAWAHSAGLTIQGANNLWIRDAGRLRILNSADTDYLEMFHDGVNFQAVFVNTTNFDFTTLTGSVRVRDGAGLQIFNSADTDSVNIKHDGTDLNFVFSNTTAMNLKNGILLEIWDLTDADWLRLAHDGTDSSLTTGGAGGGNILFEPNGTATFRVNPTAVTDIGTGASVADGADLAWRPVGFNVMPVFEKDNSTSFALSVVGFVYHKDAGGSVTFTCANDGTIPQGATYVVVNEDTEDLTIAQGSGVTIRWMDGGGITPPTGNLTLAEAGVCTVYKYSDTEFWVWGIGLT